MIWFQVSGFMSTNFDKMFFFIKTLKRQSIQSGQHKPDEREQKSTFQNLHRIL